MEEAGDRRRGDQLGRLRRDFWLPRSAESNLKQHPFAHPPSSFYHHRPLALLTLPFGLILVGHIPDCHFIFRMIYVLRGPGPSNAAALPCQALHCLEHDALFLPSSCQTVLKYVSRVNHPGM